VWTCETDPELARRSTSSSPLNSPGWPAKPLVFFSTDLVFDGRQGQYRESDPTNPIGVYAQTKAEAEASSSPTPATP
jgi:dTDP-4-dehydrorhamnose reductase